MERRKFFKFCIGGTSAVVFACISKQIAMLPPGSGWRWLFLPFYQLFLRGVVGEMSYGVN
jgi:hypothetical protein